MSDPVIRRLIGWPIIAFGMVLGGPFIIVGALIAGVKRKEVTP